MGRPTPGLTPEQKAASRAFAERNGRRWKARLLTLWTNGEDAKEPEAPYLRQIRNACGPSRLQNISKADLI